MLTESEILQFIQEDATSEKKRLAKTGLRYYEGKHYTSTVDANVWSPTTYGWEEIV